MPQNLDTSYYEKLQSGRQSRPPSRAEKLRQSASSERLDRNKFNIVKHDCLNKEVNPPTRSQSLPPRPPTRRKLSDMPTSRQNSSRAHSSGPASRRDSAQKSRSVRSQRSAKSTPPVFAHFSASIKTNSSREADHTEANEKSSSLPTPAPRNAKSKQRDTSFKNSISDHEYLQFSLRITEDIIRNDLYTNKEMRRVFNSHLEANRGRLDMDKMTEQIDNLCKELNIPLDETQDDDLVTRSQIKASRQAKKNKLSCICDPRPLNVELKDCECGSTRCLPFQCVHHCASNAENTENTSATYSTSINTTPTSQETMKDKTEEEERYTTFDTLHDDFVEVQIYDNSDSTPATPVSMSTILLNQRDNERYNAIPYYNETDDATRIRPSLGFLELPLLPSLSRVTEKTEPTTSCETVDVKLEIEPNIESCSEFDATDVLPVFEHLEQEQIESFEKNSLSDSFRQKRSITFGRHKVKKLHPNNSPQQVLEKNKQDYLVSIQPENSNLDEPHCSLRKEEDADSIEQAPSSAESENVFWLVCPYGMAEQPDAVEDTSIHNEEEKSTSERIIASTSVKSVLVHEPQMKTVCSAPPIYCTQSPSISLSTRQAVMQTKSEPIKRSSKMPVPTPRNYSQETRNASPPPFKVKPPSDLGSFKESTTESNNNGKSLKNQTPCNCDNKVTSEFQIVQLPESSNIKMRGLNNQEEEFILVSGPIYVPKSSIIPMKTENSQNIPILAPETVKRDVLTFSKDAMVNTDEQLSVRSNADDKKQTQSITSSNIKVIKEPSLLSNTSTFISCMKSNQSCTGNAPTLRDTQSDSMTYSQMHNAALDKIHFTSFVSNISRVSNIPPQPTPISESTLMTDKIQKSIAKPPKVMIKSKVCDSATKSDSGESNMLTHLNDYDLTPQRDSNRSAYSNNTSTTIPIVESQQFFIKDKLMLFNKESLLLGDEYEIKDDFVSKRSSISSCYDNGLPYTICRFYPNISTQTHSSDFLIPPTASLQMSCLDDDQFQEPKHSDNKLFNKEYEQEQQEQQEQKQQEQKKQSILKKKQMLVIEQEPAKQQELKKPESDKQQILKEQESVKQQKLEKQESDKQQVPQKQQESEKQQLPVEYELPEQSSNLFRGSQSTISEKSVSFRHTQDNDSPSELLQENNKKDDKQRNEYRLEENEKNEERKENEINEDKGENEATKGCDKNEENDKDEENEVKEELNDDDDDDEEDDDEDPFDVLDSRPPSYVHRASVMLTIKQVTADLEKFRKTEIPVDEFVQARYNIPMQNRTLNVADDLVQKQSTEKKGSVTSNVSDITNTSFNMGSNAKLPFIEVSSSEPNLQKSRERNSSESDNILCCGLRKSKKKSRRDIVDVDESAHKIPNISSIPDDQLFEMEPRRPTVDSGYGNERKSLRFDYSAMGKFSKAPQDASSLRRETLDIKDFTSAYSTTLSVANVNRVESTDTLPVRNPIVTYRTPSLPQQPKCDRSDSTTSSVQFNNNVTTIANVKRSSVVDILPPQNDSIHSIQGIENLENETINNRRRSTNSSNRS